MSGDVQPRKRKDKKRKKDELGVEETRGTAAVFGEGDVFIHSQHDHGTGGHWCAKIIFFSLLAVLVTLIGLIILENRGLTELEANSVESRYSGVLEGWLEDAPEDDHHDEHTLELKHHDDDNDHDALNSHDDIDNGEDDHDDVEDQDEDEHDDDDQEDLDEHDSEDEHDTEEDEDDEIYREEYNEDEDDEVDDQNQDVDETNNEDEDHNYIKYLERSEEDEEHNDDNDDDKANDDDDEELENDDNDTNEDDDNDTNENDNDEDEDEDEDDDDDDDDDDEDQNIDDDNDQGSDEENEDENDQLESNNQDVKEIDNSDEENDDFDQNDAFDSQKDDSGENNNEDDDDHEEDEQEEYSEVEVERIEREGGEELISSELPIPSVVSDDDDEDQDKKASKEDETHDADGDEDDLFLEPLVDDVDLPVVEHITAPSGKPFDEVEDELSSEQPPDTLAEEEEYEKRQEELRREEEQASHMWLKLTVGTALLVATHAVIRRATTSRDAPVSEDHSRREETPSLIDRRMTLIPEEESTLVTVPQTSSQPPTQEIFKKLPTIVKSSPTPKEESENEDEPVNEEDVQSTEWRKETDDKELYSDEDEVEEHETKMVEKKKDILQQDTRSTEKKNVSEPEPDEEEPDDVEIIDDEQFEDELEEEEDEEEEISDVDDAELLSRLEAKYGRLPEPERPGQKYKDGGNNIEDEWPGEPSDSYWRQELDQIEEDLRQGAWSAAAERAGAAALRASARARWLRARALDAAAERQRDNRLLTQAINAYLHLLKMNEHLTDDKLLEVTERTLDRIRFRGNYLSAEPVYRLLIRRFPDNPDFRNNLSISFLMANRPDLADEVLKETLKRWPDDRVALAHYGFVLKTQNNRLEEAVDMLQRALEGDSGSANEPRFYYHLGDTLLLLGRFSEAHEVHKRGAKLGHFLSPSQRSLYNVPRLKKRPWWDIAETPYLKLARDLEQSWRDILKEGEAARALYEKEKEGLKERGEWSQLDLFVRGREIPGRCQRAPVTCSIVRAEVAASGCRRGQIKFSAMEPGTHVRPHVGPTNCRLRIHLGLSNTKNTYIRVDKEIRQWKVGKVFIFDDSFEHEVWHNGTGTRLVLIVDAWHPELTAAERQQLPAI